MKRLALTCAAVLLLYFVLPAPALAQSANATLGGTVSDSTGALIPGVTITAMNTQTGIVNSTLTNEAGAYNFASLQPGTYRMNGELPGFQTQTYSDVALGGGQQVRLNFRLEVAGVAQAIDVSVAADTLLATTSASVGAVLPEYKVRDLPLAGRNVLDLIGTTAGTQSNGRLQGVFAGNRITAVNTTRDGMNVSEGRYDNGAFSVTYTSPDLVEEVRVVVAPVDAETARGSGQVSMVTRSGTNQFRGSVFWTNRNSALDSNNWFNNFYGVEQDYMNRNQYGARLGGPIIRNKTFFFFLFEGQRIVQRERLVGPVLTAGARQGIFRFFPGVQNGNALSSTPTVDLLGNPVTPRGATGALQSFNVFTRDPLRTGYDPSGWAQMALSRMPLPNDFTVGDGLNTAGIRWTHRVSGTDFSTGDGQDVNRDQYNFRVDHNFNANHKFSATATKEKSWGLAWPTAWPNGFEGMIERLPDVYTAALVSTLSPTIVNELRVGRRQSSQYFWAAPWVGDRVPTGQPTKEGAAAFALLPQSNGIPFGPIPTIYPNHFMDIGVNTSRANVSPLHQLSDTISWTRGQHAFKAGFEARTALTKGNTNAWLVPRVFLGPGGAQVTGIDSTTIPGLIGANQTTAQNILTDLSGSVDSIQHAFYITDTKDVRYKDYRDINISHLNYRQNEWSGFFKDDWKIRRSLTLNLGVRYDFFGVPYEEAGMLFRPSGGGAGLFGISGTSFADMFQPGRLNGSLTGVEFIGKHSPQPGKKLHDDDWNNVAPAVGLSWSLPWWGQDKTVFRAGYGISYAGGSRLYDGVSQQQSNLPGARTVLQPIMSTFTTLAKVPLPLSGPGIPGVPLEPVPLTRRDQTLRAFSDNFLIPYIQNFNVELQRELGRNLTVEVRYTGSKGTKLFSGIPLNTVNIFENGILEAFDITRAGGNAPLFDRMLRGLNLGLGAVNGTTVTGSASLRQNSLFRGNIANGNVGQFADTLNRNTVATGEAGGLLRNGGLPENFIVVNPQFNAVQMDTNTENSTYHSLNLSMTKRLSQSFTNQTTYTWSRSIGAADGDGLVNYLDPRNRSLNKTLLGFHRTHDLRSNGTFELPFGPNRKFLSSAPGVLQRLVERWQLGAIFSMSSGQPLTITSATSSIHQFIGNTPVVVGDFPKSMGEVTRLGNGVIYFDGLQQVADPARAGVTTLQATQGAFNKRAITDAQGNLLLVNPGSGQLGTLGQRWIEGPGRIGLDMNLIKRVRIDENKEFEMRVDAINVLNRPNFGNPELNINNLNFGRITTATGNRLFVINARVNF